MEWAALYLALGAVAGVLAGLLGVGGGLVIVPVLAWAFAAQGLAEQHVMHLALGTSLASIVFTSLSSIRAHHRRGAVHWPVVRRLAPGIVLGTLAGAALAAALPTDILRRVFALFVFTVAAQIGFGVQPAAHRRLPGWAGLSAAGGGIGVVSAVVGIGGGSMTVPFLIWCNTAVREAVATSAAVGLPIALAGAAGYLLAGHGVAELPSAAIGYVHGPALAGIALASVVFAPLGAHLAHCLPVLALRRVFAGVLALIGMRMLLS